MRRLYYVVAAMVLIAACTKDPLPIFEEEAEDGNVTVSMSLDMAAVADWTVVEPDTKSLGEIDAAGRLGLAVRLYVFDNNGFLVESADAYEKVNPDSPADQTNFSVDLTKSNTARRVHFVAVRLPAEKTYDQVVSCQYTFGSEATFMNGLSVADDVDAYWARVEKPNIKGPSGSDPGTTFDRVPLLRNFAKITVEMGEVNTSVFELTGFAVMNMPTKGSVAPYNTSTGSFTIFNNGENVKSYKEITATGFTGYRPSGFNMSSDWKATAAASLSWKSAGASEYMYESNNADGESRGKTFIIIKGNYTDPDTHTTYTDRYYKIDLIYKLINDTYPAPGISMFYNILRNFDYDVKIDGVSFEGYDSAAVAAAMPATNNISASVQAQGVNNVSDGNGKRRLFVNKIYSLYTTGGSKSGDLTAKAVTVAGAGQNSNLRITVLSDPDGIISGTPTIDSGTVDTDGYSQINFTLNAVSDVPRTAVIRIYINENSSYETLFRDITILLRKPYSLKVDCTDVVPRTSGTSMKARLLVNDGINEQLFPLVFLMEPQEKTIYPDASSSVKLPVHIGTTIVPSLSGSSFQYERTVTYDQYSAAPSKLVDGVYYRILDCDYKTNTDKSATTIYASNDYFDKGNGSFMNGNPVFVDGDGIGQADLYGAYARITPSDYFGVGNSFHLAYFKTVRNTGSVSIKITEGAATETVTYDLNTNAFTGTSVWPWRASSTYDSAERTYLHTIYIPVQTFDGSDYSLDVSYTDPTYPTEFSQTISGTGTQERRYIFIPLGAFQTNMGSDGFSPTERFRSRINVDSDTSGNFNMGRVGFDANGTTEVGNRDSSLDTGYTGWKFADGAGYHLGIYRHPTLSLTEDMVYRFYDSASGVNSTFMAKKTISVILAARAKDFMAEVANSGPVNYASAPATVHPADGLDKTTLTFAAP